MQGLESTGKCFTSSSSSSTFEHCVHRKIVASEAQTASSAEYAISMMKSISSSGRKVIGKSALWSLGGQTMLRQGDIPLCLWKLRSSLMTAIIISKLSSNVLRTELSKFQQTYSTGQYFLTLLDPPSACHITSSVNLLYRLQKSQTQRAMRSAEQRAKVQATNTLGLLSSFQGLENSLRKKHPGKVH